MKKNIYTIKKYPANLVIAYEKDDGEFGTDTLFFDDQAGEYTKEEWKKDDVISQYTEEGQTEILDALETTSNIDFFRK